MLKKDFAGQMTDRVIFGYNTFSFANRPHPDAIQFRWNTVDAIRTLRANVPVEEKVKMFAAGALGELMDVVLYHDFDREMILASLRGQLQPMTHEFDYMPGIEPAPTIRSRVQCRRPRRHIDIALPTLKAK